MRVVEETWGRVYGNLINREEKCRGKGEMERFEHDERL